VGRAQARGTDPVQEWDIPVGNWGGVVEEVRRWIGEIEDYEATPDLWALYGPAPTSSTVEQETDNSPFTPDERADLADRLDQVMAKLEELSDRLNLTADDVADIKENVDYLKEASERLGKKDWLLIAMGAAATYAGPIGRIFLGHMLHLPPQPPQLPL
jgi:hypothetical protein